MRFEPEGDFAPCGIGTVAGMDQVVLFADCEIAADGSRRRGCAVGRTDELTNDLDRARTFEDADDNGSTVMNSIRVEKNGRSLCSS